jgi:hypothetical protein
VGLQLSDLDDEILQLEHQRSVKKIESLESDAPSWVREIREMYRDYLDRELVARRRVALGAHSTSS